ncbi:MAG: TetR/AcrR family transcriptional regulator [Aestuariibacter sp.]
MTQNKKSSVGRPKSAEKQQQILSAASCLFLRNGLAATSMDSVAKEANVSKQTVYSHFKNKDALFTAVIRWKVKEYCLDEEHIQANQHDVKKVLQVIGIQFVQLLHDPAVISMYRVVIGEVSTNPHIAELFYEAGPKQAMELLINYLLNTPSLTLSKADAVQLSMCYFNLLKGEHLMKSLMGLPFALSKEQQFSFVNKTVDNFMLMLQVHSGDSH